jgi:hypothetical protein
VVFLVRTSSDTADALALTVASQGSRSDRLNRVSARLRERDGDGLRVDVASDVAEFLEANMAVAGAIF